MKTPAAALSFSLARSFRFEPGRSLRTANAGAIAALVRYRARIDAARGLVTVGFLGLCSVLLGAGFAFLRADIVFALLAGGVAALPVTAVFAESKLRRELFLSRASAQGLRRSAAEQLFQRSELAMRILASHERCGLSMSDDEIAQVVLS